MPRYQSCVPGPHEDAQQDPDEPRTKERSKGHQQHRASFGGWRGGGGAMPKLDFCTWTFPIFYPKGGKWFDKILHSTFSLSFAILFLLKEGRILAINVEGSRFSHCLKGCANHVSDIADKLIRIQISLTSGIFR